MSLMTLPEFKIHLGVFAESMKGLPLPEIPYKHTFVNGLYTRECELKAGMYGVSAVHKKETLAIFPKGKLKMVTQDGSRIIEGYTTVISAAGTQRAFFAITDSIILTVHRTDCLTLEDVENELFECGSDQLFGNKNNIQVIENRRLANEAIKLKNNGSLIS